MKTLAYLLILALPIFIFSCSDDDNDGISLKSSNDVTLHSGETHQIQASSDHTITYISENVSHAMVSSSGVITARLIGETRVLLDNGNESKVVKVTVAPQYNLYPDPVFDFGISREELKRKAGTPDFEEEIGEGYASVIYYNPSESAVSLVYLFEENVMYSVAVFLKPSYDNDDVTSFVSERYRYLNTQDGMRVYVDAYPVQDISRMALIHSQGTLGEVEDYFTQGAEFGYMVQYYRVTVTTNQVSLSMPFNRL